MQLLIFHVLPTLFSQVGIISNFKTSILPASVAESGCFMGPCSTVGTHPPQARADDGWIKNGSLFPVENAQEAPAQGDGEQRLIKAGITGSFSSPHWLVSAGHTFTQFSFSSRTSEESSSRLSHTQALGRRYVEQTDLGA